MKTAAPLAARIIAAPPPFDAAAGARALDAVGDCGAADLIVGVAGSSPYLAGLMMRNPERLHRILETAPEDHVEHAIAAAWRAAEESETQAQLAGLREAKASAALGLALAEVAGALDTMDAAAHWSRFADAAAGSALRMALRQIMRLGFRAADDAAPETRSGIVAIAMGKHGAFELNYSSDIDLVVLFDSGSEPLGGVDESKRLAVAATRAMVARLADQTANGYVFRTDLRLRPDPGVSAAAVSINAAETYYESYGQNWERAAFIKARAAAGDIALGEEFISRLRPFIWRKFLDFAAIEEVYAVMRQIHAAKAEGEAAFYGHDLKTGVGGIREIEFFVQAQQLIGGGKNPALRARATLDALKALTEAGEIKEETRAALDADYRYLRKAEHRLQMIADEQTHRIPASKADAARLAAFLGEESPDAFASRMPALFERVHALTGELFRTPEKAGATAGKLSFTGVETDADTIATLKSLGFARPESVADAVRRWYAGETRATRSQRARTLLAKMTPQLIEAMGRASAPDEAFAAFDGFLRGLPGGVQIFSLFLNRPDVFERLIRIMTVSPFLAREVARRAYLAEGLIEARWPSPEATREDLERELAVRLGAADGYEMALSTARRFASEESFAVSAQLLTDLITPLSAARRYTLIAEAALAGLLDVAIAENEKRFGAIEGRVAVVALGRLGERTLTATSDVDLMIIYDAAGDSDAAIDPVTWNARLVRRYVAAVTTPTEEGALYDVDMKLRPSGSKGPAAVSFSAFRKYYENEAWTWEVMALTKARVIAGDPGLAEKVEQEIASIIARPRDAAKVAADVDDMRERLRTAKPAMSPFEVKHAEGGFTELDFIAQFLAIAQSPRQLTTEEAASLARARTRFESLTQIARAAAGGVFAPGAAGEALRRMVASVFEVETVEAAEKALVADQRRVRRIYEDVVVATARAKDAAT